MNSHLVSAGLRMSLGQTITLFGIDGKLFENPKYLDMLVETLGAEPIDYYDKKVSCYGGALAFSEPEKSQALIKDIIELPMMVVLI